MFYRGPCSLHPIILKIVLFHSHVYVRCIYMYACLHVCGHMRVDSGNQPQWLIILFKDRASQSYLELMIRLVSLESLMQKSCLHFLRLKITAGMVQPLSIYMGSGDLNSGPHTCPTNMRRAIFPVLAQAMQYKEEKQSICFFIGPP